MRIDVILARISDKPAMANLLQLYLHDFSEIVSGEIGDDGRFEYPPFDAYWQGPDRFPFLIHADGKPAGFALVRKVSSITPEPVMDVAEFFVLRAWRRNGVGRAAAHALFDRFSCTWEVRVMEINAAALVFWERAVSSYEPECERMRRVHDGRQWQVFRFTSVTPGQ